MTRYKVKAETKVASFIGVSVHGCSVTNADIKEVGKAFGAKSEPRWVIAFSRHPRFAFDRRYPRHRKTLVCSPWPSFCCLFIWSASISSCLQSHIKSSEIPNCEDDLSIQVFVKMWQYFFLNVGIFYFIFANQVGKKVTTTENKLFYTVVLESNNTNKMV